MRITNEQVVDAGRQMWVVSPETWYMRGAKSQPVFWPETKETFTVNEVVEILAEMRKMEKINAI